jgi:hypothetical protein
MGWATVPTPYVSLITLHRRDCPLLNPDDMPFFQASRFWSKKDFVEAKYLLYSQKYCQNDV